MLKTKLSAMHGVDNIFLDSDNLFDPGDAALD